MTACCCTTQQRSVLLKWIFLLYKLSAKVGEGVLFKADICSSPRGLSKHVLISVCTQKHGVPSLCHDDDTDKWLLSRRGEEVKYSD